MPSSLDTLNGNEVQRNWTDTVLNLAAFNPHATLPETKALNNVLVERCKNDVNWWECGAEEYRKRRRNGETPFPQPITLENTLNIFIPSKYHHEIPCRLFNSSNLRSKPKGVLYHIHGGGWVLGSAAGQDLYLDELARRAELVVISIEYRLAPEHPFPASPSDCYEVADWLITNCNEQWGCDLKFVCGESGGATLASLVIMYLRDSGKSSSITGAIFNYGCFDLSILPSARALDPSRPLILSYESILKFIEAYTPGMSWDGRKHPTISPAYNNLNNLTPALFIVGTEDGMIDDTILMSGKWEIAGNKTVVKFVPGAPHGFITFDGNKVGVTKQGWDLIIDYLLSNM